MIQIIGTKKDRQTAKAIRFCKERSIAYQFVDLGQRSLSMGEWDAIFARYSPESVIDTTASAYKKGGYDFRIFDARTEVVEHPDLLSLPIIRSRSLVHIGYDEAILASWGGKR